MGGGLGRGGGAEGLADEGRGDACWGWEHVLGPRVVTLAHLHTSVRLTDVDFTQCKSDLNIMSSVPLYLHINTL